jgi:nitric oxide reductase NorD protein
VPEAEDVLLEAAERATHLVRAAWARHAGPPSRGESRAATSALHRRLLVWQAAWLGRSWPVESVDPRPAPGAFTRWMRRLPPWAVRDRTAPFTDGLRICLPRPWRAGRSEHAEDDPVLIATLGLARRLARAEGFASAPAPGLARDLWWIAEGALGDAALARAWPGLAAPLRALRRSALADRPTTAGMRATEQAVERWIRELLDAEPDAATDDLLDGLDADASPGAVAAFAERRRSRLAAAADGYRGFAPVNHWGADHGFTTRAGVPPSAADASRARAPRRGTRLPRPLRRRAPEPDADERPGPFVLPFADPHLTVDDPGASRRPADQGRDEDLETLAEEIARLEELPAVRNDASVREILESPGAAGGADPRPARLPADGAPVWLYPEWDATRRAYRRPGCRVRELPAPADDAGWSDAVLRTRRSLLVRLRSQLESIRPRRERLRRQPYGDDFDVAAWVEDWADRHADRPPSGRIYTREDTRRRDVAVTLLLDASGSTESWLAGRQRVIDVVKEAALVFAEALSVLGDRFALYAFSGQGAADVRMPVLKRFEEPAGPAVRHRIGALESDAFTRLGGAVRHATAGLARQRARARLLLVLSDGRPQDEDGYEGRYGIEDVRQAVAEARLQGVHVFAITVDREGPAYLPRLFGPFGYTVIWNAEALPDRLPGIYRRLTAGA